MADSVKTVLSRPSSSPAITTQTMMPMKDSTRKDMTASRTARPMSVTMRLRRRPIRFVSSGAPNTEVIATQMPQPKKT